MKKPLIFVLGIVLGASVWGYKGRAIKNYFQPITQTPEQKVDKMLECLGLE